VSGRIPWRAIGVVLVAVVIVASSAIAYRLAAIPETLSETSVVSTSAPVELVTLHVAGAVRSPGR
jgi:hypothetical protein